MRNPIIMLAAGLSLALSSCGETAEPKEEKTTYTLDAENTSLAWKGSENPEYFHVGTIAITEGSLEMEGEKLSGGTFTIDMSSITVTDEGLPDDKKSKLVEHLKAPDFFSTASNPKAKVSLNGYENGKLDVTLSIMGKDLKQSLPVKLDANEKGATITGKFPLDVAELKLTGMQPDPKSGEKIQSIIEFDLKVTMKK